MIQLLSIIGLSIVLGIVFSVWILNLYNPH